MALIGSKRPRETVVPSSKKRQKLDKAFPGLKANGDTTVPDSLPWNDVPLPDRLDDAEGFFGLEEVDDVEVVKDSISGRVGFRVSSNAERREITAIPTSGVTRNTQTAEEAEWGGLDSSASNHTRSPSPLGESIARPETSSYSHSQTKASKKPQRRGKEVHRKAELGSVQVNAFEALAMATDEEANVSAWAPLNLSSDTLSSLARQRFAKPTPIQLAAIPEILDGHDLIGKASTGSGKTLAFGIPIFEYYLKHGKAKSTKKIRDSVTIEHPPIALILSPTRELAHQLSAHLRELCINEGSEGPRIATLTGGLSIYKQQRMLSDADLIVGTPGRLWEVISGSNGLLLRLQKIRFLVLDEADRLLSEGHFKEIEEILTALGREVEDEDKDEVLSVGSGQKKPQRQTLVFSATFQKDLQQRLAGKLKPAGNEIMNKQESLEYLLKKLKFREENPRFIDVNPVSQMAVGLKEGIVECAALEKDLYLYSVLLQHPKTRTLVFTNSIASVRRLLPFLQNLNLPIHAIHSEMPQKARLRAIERFSSPSSPGSILIATDIAARGLDIPSVDLIVHYHLPRAADMYVHRSGRTARAEKSGLSILLCAPEEIQGVRRLVAKVHLRNGVGGGQDPKKFFIRTIDLDRQIVARLKPRVELSKKISDASLAKEKKSHETNWLKTAGDDLGVDYDSEEFNANEGSKKGRGSGRKKAEEKARSVSKSELTAMRGELKSMLAKRVNIGVSERYLSAGGVDIEELLSGQQGEFIGKANIDLEG